MLFEEIFRWLARNFLLETRNKFDKLQQIFTNAKAQMQKRTQVFSFSILIPCSQKRKRETKALCLLYISNSEARYSGSYNIFTNHCPQRVFGDDVLQHYVTSH